MANNLIEKQDLTKVPTVKSLEDGEYIICVKDNKINKISKSLFINGTDLIINNGDANKILSQGMYYITDGINIPEGFEKVGLIINKVWKEGFVFQTYVDRVGKKKDRLLWGNNWINNWL